MAQGAIKTMSELPKAANLKLIETSLTNLSIEEKEKLYKVRGLLDEAGVEKVRAETEASMLRRLAAAEAEKVDKERSESVVASVAVKPTEESKAAPAAFPPRQENFRFSRGDGAGGALLENDAAWAGERRGEESSLTASSSLATPLASKMEWDADAGRVVEVDPILGHLLGRLGSRRIFLMEVPALASIPVWEKQRVYRKERARRIAEGVVNRHKIMFSGDTVDAADKNGQGRSLENSSPILVPGVIALYEKAWEEEEEEKGAKSPETGGSSPPSLQTLVAARRRRYGIVDGQHRVGALKLLHDKGDPVGRVVVEVYSVQSEEEIVALFCDINKAEPVKDVDLPFRPGPAGGGGGGASAKEREILAGALEALATTYPDFFKDTPRCLKPNVHMDTMRDLLFKAKVVDSVPCKSDEDLLTWLLMKNEELSALSDEEWAAMLQPSKPRKSQAKKATAATKATAAAAAAQLSTHHASALRKARKFGFFLGLDTRWVESDSDFEGENG